MLKLRPFIAALVTCVSTGPFAAAQYTIPPQTQDQPQRQAQVPAQAEGGNARPTLPEQMTFKRHTLKWLDMDSHTLLLPPGWKVEGGGWAPPAQAGYFRVLPSQEITITTDLGLRLDIGPTATLYDARIPPHLRQQFGQVPPDGANVNGNMKLRLPRSNEAWGELIAKGLRDNPDRNVSNVSVQKVTPIEPANSQLRQQVRQQAQQMGAFNTPPGLPAPTVDGTVLQIELTYTEDGREMMEAAWLAASWWISPRPDFNNPGGVAAEEIFWDLRSGMSIAVPKELEQREAELEAQMPMVMLVISTIRPTDAYVQFVMKQSAQNRQLDQNMARESLETYRKIAEINRETGEYVRRNQQEGYEDRTESQERLAERTVNVLTDREDYLVPGTNEYLNLPSGYDHAYYGDDGTVILTNDANFVDSAPAGTTYQPMKVRP